MADLSGRDADKTKEYILTFDENGGSPEYTKIEDANGVDRTAEVVELLGINDKASLSGTAIQTISATKTNTYSESTEGAGQFTSDIPGLIINITPKSTDSKILVFGFVSVGQDTSHLINVYRDGSPLARGDEAGDRIRYHSPVSEAPGRDIRSGLGYFQVLDAPNTSQEVTYSVRVGNHRPSEDITYINRVYDDSNQDTRGRSSSTITVMEIG